MKKRFFLFGLVFVMTMQVDWQPLDPFGLTEINLSSDTGPVQTAEAGSLEVRENRVEDRTTIPRPPREAGITPKQRERITEEIKDRLERVLERQSFGRGESSEEQHKENNRKKFFESVAKFIEERSPTDPNSLEKGFKETSSDSIPGKDGGPQGLSAQYQRHLRFRNKVRECQAVLGFFGYYDGKLDDIHGTKTKKAIQAFQKDIEIPISGILDTTTEAAIDVWALALEETLSDIGFAERRLSGAISSYARHLGFKEPLGGQALAKFREDLAFDLRLKKDLLAVDRSPAANDAILAFEKSDSGSQVFLKRPDGRLEFWRTDEEGIKERKADRATLASLNQIGMNEVKINSDELISFVGMGFIGAKGSGSINFQFGEATVEIGQSEMKNLFTGKGETPALDKLYATKTLPRKMIIWRDHLSRVDENQEQFKYDREYRMKFAGEMGYPSAERTELLIRLAEGLDRRYAGKCEILFDDDMKIGRDNANTLPGIGGPEDIAVYVPHAGWGVQDYRVIERIEDELDGADIKTVRGVMEVPMLNIIIITAHKDQAFRSYLENLGTKGCLRNKYVLLLSCHEKGDETFNSKLIEKYGAKAIQAPSNRIHPQAVEESLVRLSGMIKDRPAAKTSFHSLWQKAVEKAVEETSNPILRREIEVLHRGIPQVSFLEGLRYFGDFSLCAQVLRARA